MVDFAKKFIKNKNGKYILSIILGFGLATLFRVACKGNKCVTFRAAPVDQVDGSVYKFGDTCYTFSHSSASAGHVKNKRIVEF